MGIPAGTSVGPYDTFDYVYAETLPDAGGLDETGPAGTRAPGSVESGNPEPVNPGTLNL